MPLESDLKNHGLFFNMKVDELENKWNIFMSSSVIDSSVWSLNRICVEYFLCCHMYGICQISGKLMEYFLYHNFRCLATCKWNVDSQWVESWWNLAVVFSSCLTLCKEALFLGHPGFVAACSGSVGVAAWPYWLRLFRWTFMDLLSSCPLAGAEFYQ